VLRGALMLSMGCSGGDGDAEGSFTGVTTAATSTSTGATSETTAASDTTSDTDATVGDGDGDGDATTGGCQDLDGDGWTTCEGDCCDAIGTVCSESPQLVNPGAFDVPGNMLDDDCDGTMDNPIAACDDALTTDSQDPEDYARAIDLCRFVDEAPADPMDRRWGLVEANLSLTDGTGAPHMEGHSIRPDFGPSILPQGNATMAVFSSGHAADATDTSPDFVSPQDGVDFGTGIGIPAPTDWLAAHGDTFPNPLGCPDPWSNEAHDAQMLTLRVRAPTNARSFTFKFNFFSSEYPEWVCSTFNDFFVALIDSDATNNPADKNLAVWDDGSTTFPVGINLVESAAGLFTVCENGETGCRGSLQSNYTDCSDPGALLGTGFDVGDGICPVGSMGANGGGTGWLEVAGNVAGGEIITVRMAIWDGSGHLFDSTVLVDDWQWSLDAATPGIYIP
jgi:hypothetical protein